MAGLSAGDRGRQLADRRDGQGRRPLLLLQGDPAGAWPASTVDADRRPRGRSDQPRARRFRGRGDGPHRPPGRARRPRVPHHRPDPEDRRPGDQRVCARRARSRGHDADRPPDDQRGPQAGAEDACPAPAREAHHRSGAGRLRHPARGPLIYRLSERVRLEGRAGGARGLGNPGPGAGGLRRQAVGLLGAKPRPGPVQGPFAARGDRGQGGAHHRRVERHRKRAGAEGRGGGRQGRARRAIRGQAPGDQGRDRVGRWHGGDPPGRPLRHR